MRKFTAGPWEVVKHERFPFQREVKAEDGYICDMEGLSDNDMPTINANANLIAAAPLMYEALKEVASAEDLSDWVDNPFNSKGCKLGIYLTVPQINKLLAALAKADGGTR